MWQHMKNKHAVDPAIHFPEKQSNRGRPPKHRPMAYHSSEVVDPTSDTYFQHDGRHGECDPLSAFPEVYNQLGFDKQKAHLDCNLYKSLHKIG
jgi:hypothetical protein